MSLIDGSPIANIDIPRKMILNVLGRRMGFAGYFTNKNRSKLSNVIM